eukprot:289383_1
MSSRKRKKLEEDILNESPKKKARRIEKKSVLQSEKNDKQNKRKRKALRKKQHKYKYHPGELEVDYDGGFWDDHDEPGHGIIDSNWSRRTYPEGFIWSCCNKHGDKPGCQSCTESPMSVSEQYPTSSEPSLDETEMYHCGVLEVDYDDGFWDDSNEPYHETIDTKTNRKEYPEGFKWSCCDKVGTFAEGCCKVE